MNTRLKQFMAAENVTQSQLADSLNVVRASVSHILSGRNNPSYEFIKALMSRYPRLNMEWLMFGKGKMYKDSLTSSEDMKNGTGGQVSLFSENDGSVNEDADTEYSVHESAAKDTESGKTGFPTELNTLYQSVQNTMNQRKVVKVIVLFDDGAYQEL